MARQKVCWWIGLSLTALVLMAELFEMCWSRDLLGVLLLWPVLIFSGVILVSLAMIAGRERAPRFAVLILVASCVAYGMTTAGTLLNVLRFETRWVFTRSSSMNEMRTHLATQNGIKYFEWDTWGMAGQDTIVYLVYDPADRLRHPRKTAEGRTSSGLPHEVWQIWRLEPHWYSVVFYTNSCWDCPEDGS